MEDSHKELLARAREKIARLQSELNEMRRHDPHFPQEIFDENYALKTRVRKLEKLAKEQADQLTSAREQLKYDEKRLQEAKDSIIEKDEAIEEWIAHCQALNRRTQELDGASEPVRHELNQANVVVASLKADLKKYESENSMLHQEIGQLQGRVESFQAQINQQLEQMETYHTNNESYRQKNADLQAQLASVDMERRTIKNEALFAKEKIDEMNRRIASEQEKVQAEKQRCGMLIEANRALEAKVAKIQHTMDVQKAAFERAVDELTTASSEVAHRADQYESTLKQMQSTSLESTDESTRLRQEIAARDRRIERRNTQLHQMSEQLMRFKDLLQRNSDQLEMVVAERDAALTEVENLKHELLDLDNQIRIAKARTHAPVSEGSRLDSGFVLKRRPEMEQTPATRKSPPGN